MVLVKELSRADMTLHTNSTTGTVPCEWKQQNQELLSVASTVDGVDSSLVGDFRPLRVGASRPMTG